MTSRAVLLAALLAAGPALAGSSIEATPGDNPLVITGWVGEEGSFVGNVGLSTREKEMKFVSDRSDLRGPQPDEVIHRHQIQVTGGPTLTLGQPVNVRINVTGVTRPGDYTGKISFRPENSPQSQWLEVKLKVVARVRPTVNTVLPGNQLQLQLVRTTWCADRLLAGLLLPDSAFQSAVLVPLENPTAGSVEVESGKVIGVGKLTGFPLTENQLKLAGPSTVPGRDVGGVTVVVQQENLPPDRYAGDLYLRLKNGEKLVRVPVDVSVRTGPFWPMAFLLVGILLGRLIKYMQERGGSQAAALVSVNRAATRLAAAHPDDQKLLDPMLDAVRQAVYHHRLTEVPPALAVLETRLAILTDLRAVEMALAPKRGNSEVDQALAKVGEARTALAVRDDERGRRLLDEVKAILSALKVAQGGGPERVLADAEARVTTAAERVAEGAVPPESDWFRRLKGFLTGLSGLSDELRAEATLWLARPLLYLVTLAALLAVGVESFYVTKGAAFGAQPFADYLSLVLWGLGADVASRSLSNLRG